MRAMHPRLAASAALLAAGWAAADNLACSGTGMDWYITMVGETPCQTYQKLRQICNAEFAVGVMNVNTPPDFCTDQVSSCCCNSIAFALSMLCLNCQQNIGTGTGFDAGAGAYQDYLNASDSGTGHSCASPHFQSLPTDIQTAVCNEKIKINDDIYSNGWSDGSWFYMTAPLARSFPHPGEWWSPHPGKRWSPHPGERWSPHAGKRWSPHAGKRLSPHAVPARSIPPVPPITLPHFLRRATPARIPSLAVPLPIHSDRIHARHDYEGQHRREQQLVHALCLDDRQYVGVGWGVVCVFPNHTKLINPHSPTKSSTLSHSSSLTSGTSASSGTAAADAAATAHKSSALAAGAIAGIAVGAAVLLLAAGLVFWFLRKRQRTREYGGGGGLGGNGGRETAVLDDSLVAHVVSRARPPVGQGVMCTSSPYRVVSICDFGGCGRDTDSCRAALPVPWPALRCLFGNGGDPLLFSASSCYTYNPASGNYTDGRTTTYSDGHAGYTDGNTTTSDIFAGSRSEGSSSVPGLAGAAYVGASAAGYDANGRPVGYEANGRAYDSHSQSTGSGSGPLAPRRGLHTAGMPSTSTNASIPNPYPASVAGTASTRSGSNSHSGGGRPEAGPLPRKRPPPATPGTSAASARAATPGRSPSEEPFMEEEEREPWVEVPAGAERHLDAGPVSDVSLGRSASGRLPPAYGEQFALSDE
ncbi:hypothetical protein C8R44DRAFT_858959 [Mycena epipterygia]|nr:hypothetical protein C8R44DRAFT_858959 [Mycena epipterygia]